MPRPNGGLITETNRQYYAGAQQQYYAAAGTGNTITSTFDTNLIFGSSDPSNGQYGLNNFKVYTSPNALTWVELTPVNSATTSLAPVAGVAANAAVTITILVANVNVVPGMVITDTTSGATYGSVTSVTSSTVFVCNIATGIPALAAGQGLTFTLAAPWTELNNIITIASFLPAAYYVKIQLSETAIDQNHGSYEYTRLTDVIDNFLIAYVGAGKLIPSVKRTDVIFHAKRGMQEFSYDTLKSVRSQELTVNTALNVIIPQDYVNYVRVSWVDGAGVQRTIFPANNLTTNPYSNPVQDQGGTPTQDAFDSNLTGTSQTEAAWAANNPRNISGAHINDYDIANVLYDSMYDQALGQRYGLNPETSQRNGWFTINEREGTFAFSNDLKSKLIILEYISDGNAYDLDMRIPKLAEEALYAYIVHSILSLSVGIQEYVVRRFQKEKSAKLRNAKIRISNIKPAEIVQVMRNQSKWIKY